ncbi:MAG: enhancer of mRNA decapping [Cirrosporium novae-zelandiae]|nr:MAG: enhancer of mRNA decapping [Cirrosporium novae-zelandiae]
MAAGSDEYIGSTLLLTLNNPPDIKLRGVVERINGPILTLKDLIVLSTGENLPICDIDGANIADLDVLPTTDPTPPEPAIASSALPSSVNIPHRPLEQSQPDMTQAETFVDPAILSFSRPSDREQTPVKPVPPPIPKELLLQAEGSSPGRNRPTIPSSYTTPKHDTYGAPNSYGRKDGIYYEDTEASYIKVDHVVYANENEQPLKDAVSYPGKPNTRGGKHNLLRDASIQTAPPEGSPQMPDSSPEDMHSRTAQTNIHSKGWRHSSLLEEPHLQGLAGSPQAPSGKQSRSKGKRGRPGKGQVNSGWATEDATDIQEMGDFDFEANLSKFDKRTIFDQIRNDDKTAESERLVSFNRQKPRPGTNGGKNLHYTENVLDPDPPATQNNAAPWDSEAGDTEDGNEKHSETKFDSGRGSHGRQSRASAKIMSRKPSALGGSGSGGLPGVSSSSMRGSTRRGKQVRHEGDLQQKLANLAGNTTPASAKPSFHLHPSGKFLYYINPLHLLELEQLCITELGMTEDMLTENAARGVVGAAFQCLDKINGATILALVGNHKCGYRAIAAARHLRNRGARVSVCVLGHHREHEFMDEFRRQVKVFQKNGGRIISPQDTVQEFGSRHSSPHLIIDALFGIHVNYDDLRTDDQQATLELMELANKKTCNVIAVDVPSGLSATTGEVIVYGNVELLIQPDIVVSLALPKVGLYNYMMAGNGENWHLFVADIGIGSAAWKKKFGTRRRHVDFGNEYLVHMKYQAGGT